MAWNYEHELKRIQEHVGRLGDIEVSKLVREADLSALLSETSCREIYGAHTYAVVSNFSALASELSDDTDYRRLIQSVHIYQREASRIVERNELFAGGRMFRRFQQYLTNVRGATLSTDAQYRRILRPFLVGLCSGDEPDWSRLTAEYITDFVIRQTTAARAETRPSVRDGSVMLWGIGPLSRICFATPRAALAHVHGDQHNLGQTSSISSTHCAVGVASVGVRLKHAR